MARVYVSSTLRDLQKERTAVIDWLVAADHQPVHSYRPGSDTVRVHCLEDVTSCDLYVLILGHSYGHQPADGNPDNLSITQLEFRRAGEVRIPRIVLRQRSIGDVSLTDVGNAERYALQNAFAQEVQTATTPYDFKSDADLISGLSTGMTREVRRLAATDPEVMRIVAKLTIELDRTTKQLEGTTKQLGEKDDRIRKLEQQQQAGAVARTLTEANKPDASPAAVAAAVALRAGDSRPAEQLLNGQERQAAAKIDQQGADEKEQRRRAAELACEQGALAMGHDVAAALAAYQRAADYDPDDLWTRIYIGDLHRLLGDGSAAVDVFRRCLELATARSTADPTNAHRLRDLALSHERIGEVLRDRGDGPGALDAFRASLEIAEQLSARDPANTERLRDVAISHNKVGNVLRDQGDGSGALKAFRADLAITERLASSDANHAEWQRDLWIAHSKIGDVLVEQGDGPGALKAFQTSLAICTKLASSDPANTQWQRDLSVSHERVGGALRDQGDGPGALAAFHAALDLRIRLAAHDPANTQWQRDLSIGHSKLGIALRDEGDTRGALRAFRTALEIGERLAKRDPLNAQWQRDVSACHYKIGQTLNDGGDGPGALRAFRAALAITEQLAARDRANTILQRDLAHACFSLGTLRVVSADERRQHLERGQQIARHLVAERSLHGSQKLVDQLSKALADLQSSSG